MNKINLKVIYVHSEKFVENMVRSLKNNSIEKFKKYYRKVDLLLIDDIQFFQNKIRSQEELLHTIIYILENKKKIIITANKHPNIINNIEERLKSRFNWGMVICIKNIKKKTIVNIIKNKLKNKNIKLKKKVIDHIYKYKKFSIKELESVLNKILTISYLKKKKITINFIKKINKENILYKKKISIEKIKQTVANYYNLSPIDLTSKYKYKSITMARHIAIAISKKLTNKSLIEIGKSFGGRDHTTILYSYRKINYLRKKNKDIQIDFRYLIQTLIV